MNPNAIDPTKDFPVLDELENVSERRGAIKHKRLLVFVSDDGDKSAVVLCHITGSLPANRRITVARL
jgi:hypothetical protein